MKRKVLFFIIICILTMTMSFSVSAAERPILVSEEETSESDLRAQWWAVIKTTSGMIYVPPGTTIPGASSYYVRLLQCCLNRIGGYGLATDGICGTNTINAIKQFQHYVGTEQDGVAGFSTWRRLDSIVNSNGWTITF